MSINTVCRYCEQDMLKSKAPTRYRGMEFCSPECRDAYKDEPHDDIKNKSERGPGGGYWSREDYCGLWEEDAR